MSNEEEIIRDEDCNEDKLGHGWLTLTNKRIIFRKEHSRVGTFSKGAGEIALDITLDKIKNVRSEGFIAKKLIIEVDRPYKFGVLEIKNWLKDLNDAISSYSK